MLDIDAEFDLVGEGENGCAAGVGDVEMKVRVGRLEERFSVWALFEFDF